MTKPLLLLFTVACVLQPILGSWSTNSTCTAPEVSSSCGYVATNYSSNGVVDLCTYTPQYCTSGRCPSPARDCRHAGVLKRLIVLPKVGEGQYEGEMAFDGHGVISQLRFDYQSERMSGNSSSTVQFWNCSSTNALLPPVGIFGRRFTILGQSASWPAVVLSKSSVRLRLATSSGEVRQLPSVVVRVDVALFERHSNANNSTEVFCTTEVSELGATCPDPTVSTNQDALQGFLTLAKVTSIVTGILSVLLKVAEKLCNVSPKKIVIANGVLSGILTFGTIALLVLPATMIMNANELNVCDVNGSQKNCPVHDRFQRKVFMATLVMSVYWGVGYFTSISNDYFWSNKDTTKSYWHNWCSSAPCMKSMGEDKISSRVSLGLTLLTEFFKFMLNLGVAADVNMVYGVEQLDIHTGSEKEFCFPRALFPIIESRDVTDSDDTLLARTRLCAIIVVCVTTPLILIAALIGKCTQCCGSSTHLTLSFCIKIFWIVGGLVVLLMCFVLGFGNLFDLSAPALELNVLFAVAMLVIRTLTATSVAAWQEATAPVVKTSFSTFN